LTVRKKKMIKEKRKRSEKESGGEIAFAPFFSW